MNQLTLPRLIGLKDAPHYLGMSKNKFGRLVRPYIPEIREGRSVIFDRFDLDSFAEIIKRECGRPGKKEGANLWDANERRGSSKGKGSGTSTNAFAVNSSAKARARKTSKKRNYSLQESLRNSGSQQFTESDLKGHFDKRG